MDPSPVTGSQPLVAVNPAVQQVGDDVLDLQQLLLPDVISLNFPIFAYNVGLIKPTVERPAC